MGVKNRKKKKTVMIKEKSFRLRFLELRSPQLFLSFFGMNWYHGGSDDDLLPPLPPPPSPTASIFVKVFWLFPRSLSLSLSLSLSPSLFLLRVFLYCGSSVDDDDVS